MNARRFTLLSAVTTALSLCVLSAYSLAFTPEEKSEALIAVTQKVVQTEAFVVACAQKYPNFSADNQKALAAWKARNGLQDFDRVLAAYAKQNPEIAQKLEAIRTSYVNLILKQTPAKLEPICRGLAKMLEQPSNNTLKTDHAADLEVIAEMARDLDRKPAPDQTSSNQPVTNTPSGSNTTARASGTVYTIAQLSGLISSVYEATKEYAKKDDAVEAKLKSLGTIYVKGIAGEYARLYSEKGKFESKYRLSCSFSDRADSSAFGKLIGREVVIAGRFKEFKSYFGVDLQDCALISDASSLKRSSLSEDAGLKRKPVTAQEVMTKPGAGLKTSQIQGMYFFHKNNQRIDGFGNLYIDVDERSYLVLKDGSAYRYDWGFPPEDFDVAASRREEPKAWGRWSDKSYDGISNSDFDKLLPGAKGLRFDHYYSITATSMGGSIRESGIRFTKDGRFESDTTAMLAGFTQGGGIPDSGVTTGSTNVTTSGSGQTMVSTAPASSSAEGTYSIDGYTMTLRLPDGSVSRSFFGIPSYVSQTNPKYLVYRGAFWFGSGK